MTAVPGKISWISTSRTYAANAGPSIAPLMTDGAIRVSQVSSSDQGLFAPAAGGCIHDQPLTLRAPAAKPVEVHLHCRFVKKHNAIRHAGDGRHAMRNLFVALPSHFCASSLGGHQLLIFVREAKARQHTCNGRMVDGDAFGLGQRITQLEKGKVGVLRHQFFEETDIGHRLSAAWRTAHRRKTGHA